METSREKNKNKIKHSMYIFDTIVLFFPLENKNRKDNQPPSQKDQK